MRVAARSLHGDWQAFGLSAEVGFTAHHRFCRWDDSSGERFNVEGAGLGLSTHPDQYYREGIFAEKDGFEAAAGSMLSLGPRRELAGFLNERFEYWWNGGHFRNAVNCLAWSAELDGYPLSTIKLEFSLNEWGRALAKRVPSRLMTPVFEILRRRFRLIPQILEEKMEAFGVRDDVLRDYHLHGIKNYPGWTTEPVGELIPLFKHYHGQLPWKFADEHPAW